MNGTIKISIITVCYNAENTLKKTIESVISQDYNNIEYIIIDGGSTDGTVDIIKKYSYRISYWISEKDNGIYDAMNKGLSKITGDLIGIINSDDWYANNIFTDIADIYTKTDKRTVIHGNLVFIEKEQEKEILRPNLNHESYYRGTPFCHPTMFVPTIIYKEIGDFNILYRIAADYDFMLRFIDNGYKQYYYNKVISYMRTGGESEKNIIKGYKESCNIAIKHKYSKIKTYSAFLSKIYYLYKTKLFFNS